MQLNQITSLAFFVVSTLLLARATAAAADGYLEKKITVRGTNIDRFPNFVEIITSDPRGEAAELFAAGGRNLSEERRWKPFRKALSPSPPPAEPHRLSA